MKTQFDGILENLILQVKDKIIEKYVPIDEWTTKTGIHKKPGCFVYSNNEPEIMRTGDRWNVGYDDTRWFSADVVVPDDFDSRKLYLYLDFGGEGIVRVNGKIIGAISNEANWEERDVVLLGKKHGGEKLNIEAESTVNCSVYCSKAMLGDSYLTYTIKSGRLAVINDITEQYYFDVSSAMSSLKFIDDRVIHDRVFTAVDESIHALDFDFDDETFYKSVPKAKEIFNEMLNAIPDAKQGKICMLGHSHLDVAWLWTTRELVRKTARTFSNNIALMREYPEFKFTQSQAIVYDYMKKYYPEIFAQVKKMVKAGKWEIVGNAWVEADTNLASGESLVRQLLYGREFFMKEFGVSSDTYWLPDCFGFTWAMPQIISRSGMKYFYTAKLYYNSTNKFPYSIFNWKSHSGDKVIACVQQAHYQSSYDAEYLKMCWERSNQKDITSKAVGAFGYGDGGGGCTYSMLERSKRFENMPGIPKAENCFASEFFDGLDSKSDELPTFNDEMYYENHRGTFTSQAFIKKNNRRGEFMLRNAEFLCLLAQKKADAYYPYENMEKCWKLLLTNQFHDILPGTSIHEAVEMTRQDYVELNELGNEILKNALTALNKNIDIKEKSVIVWNMNSMPVSDEVSVEIDGEKVSFIAENIPSMGYKTFAVDSIKNCNAKVIAEKNLLENSKLRVSLDENGIITEIYDKVNLRQVLACKGNMLTVFQDKPIHESAWNLELNYQKKFWNLEKADSIEVIEKDGARGVIRIVRSFNKSVITQDIILCADADYVDFDTNVSWFETEKVLKAAFPVNVTNTNATYEIAHGSIDRPTHWNYTTDMVRYEVCGHKWADISEGDYGVSLINDCKYGYDIKDNIMRITLMRAPICPDPVGDKGDNSFVYRLYPHSGTWQQADTVKNAFKLNQPLIPFVSDANDGKSDKCASFIEIDKESIIVDAVKPAQDGDGIILRMYEAEKKRGNVSVKINFTSVASVTECNLMEVDENKIEVKNNSFDFYITPNQVRTFRIR